MKQLRVIVTAFLFCATGPPARSSIGESHFATLEEAEAYDEWFRAKVQASLDDERPLIRHDRAMAAFREIIEAKRRAHASGPVAD